MPVPYTETLTVYRPTQTIAADLNVLPGAVALVDDINANIHRGTQKSRDAATALGIFNVQSGNLYTSVDNAGKIGDRYVISDQKGATWVVRGIPSVRDRFPATAHVKALVTLLRMKPVGVP